MECPVEVPGDPVKAAEVVRRCGVLREQGLQGGPMVGGGHEALGWAGKSSWGGGRVSGCREGAFPAHGPHYPCVKGG